MSTQPTPLDALMAKIDELVAHAREDERLCYDQVPSQRYADFRDDLRAILEKWGTPATGGGPVASVQKDTLAMLQSGQCKPWDGGARLHPPHRAKFETDYVGVFTSPQPVREPLSDEQIKDLIGFGDPTEQEKHLIRKGFDAAHGIGITGGQHGTY